MRTLDFLARLHETLDPPTYLEIGVRHGDSLVHSRSPSVAIDPRFRLKHPVPEGAVLFEETSDAYFEREHPLEPFGGRPAALALIDGMHLSEHALRDFVNVERHSDWTSVVALDDIVPRSAEEASRERTTTSWTGDVFKIMGILSANRPDLIQLRVGTRPTGLLLVLALDPQSDVLDERFEELAAQAVALDPERLASEHLDRRGLLDPESVLSASFWSWLRDAREQNIPRSEGVGRLRAALDHDFGPGWRTEGPRPRLPRSLGRLRRAVRRTRPG